MRRFRQKLYRTRIGARQKQPFLNHLQLIINFFTCFSQTTLEKLSLIGAASEADRLRRAAERRRANSKGNYRPALVFPCAPRQEGVRGRSHPGLRPRAARRSRAGGVTAGRGSAKPSRKAPLTSEKRVRGMGAASKRPRNRPRSPRTHAYRTPNRPCSRQTHAYRTPNRQCSPQTHAYRTPRGPTVGIVAARF